MADQIRFRGLYLSAIATSDEIAETRRNEKGKYVRAIPSGVEPVMTEVAIRKEVEDPKGRRDEGEMMVARKGVKALQGPRMRGSGPAK